MLRAEAPADNALAPVVLQETTTCANRNCELDAQLLFAQVVRTLGGVGGVVHSRDSVDDLFVQWFTATLTNVAVKISDPHAMNGSRWDGRDASGDTTRR